MSVAQMCRRCAFSRDAAICRRLPMYIASRFSTNPQACLIGVPQGAENPSKPSGVCETARNVVKGKPE